jgi:hypothetical protein
MWKIKKSELSDIVNQAFENGWGASLGDEESELMGRIDRLNIIDKFISGAWIDFSNEKPTEMTFREAKMSPSNHRDYGRIVQYRFYTIKREDWNNAINMTDDELAAKIVYGEWFANVWIDDVDSIFDQQYSVEGAIHSVQYEVKRLHLNENCDITGLDYQRPPNRK